MYYLEFSQTVPLSLKKSWDFFSSPSNLALLTPPELHFEMVTPEEEKMYPGQIISHLIRPVWNFPIEWVTEITQVKELDYFIDEQRFGPYKFWHHEHRFVEVPGGVEIIDKIYYKMPFGIFGKMVHFFKVERDLQIVFSYRHAKLEELFGTI